MSPRLLDELEQLGRKVMAKNRNKWSNGLAGPDQDYWRVLNDFEKGWLNEFNQRYYKGARFDPVFLSPDQYEKAGQGAGKRNDERSRALDNRHRPTQFIDGSGNSTPTVPKLPHSPDFEFPKRNGRPKKTRIKDEDLFK